MPKTNNRPSCLGAAAGLVLLGWAMGPASARAEVGIGPGLHVAYSVTEGKLGVGGQITGVGAPHEDLLGGGGGADFTWFPGAYHRISVSARGILSPTSGDWFVAAGPELGLVYTRDYSSDDRSIGLGFGVIGQTQPGPYLFFRGNLPVIGKHEGLDLEVGLGAQMWLLQGQ